MTRKLKYRCGRAGCRAIHTLTKPPGHYRQERKCHCGGNLHDYSMDRKRNKARTCHCDGRPHPHKRGTKFCVESKYQPTEEEMRDHMNSFFNKDRR